MRPFLLDVNVLVALMWPPHVHHESALDWFDIHKLEGFRTCPLTQAGAVRVFSNPRYSPDRVTVNDAQRSLNLFTSLPEHEFWPDELNLSDAISLAGGISGHQQITDAYLAALAMSKGGILATFDKGALALQGARGFIELIS